jgi:ABC-2 type transport system permease protein
MPTPKFVFPLSDLIVALVHSGFALVAFLILAVAFGASLRRQLVVLPAGACCLAMFTFGLALVAMTLMTFFRDFAHIIGVVLTAYYFASPILYPPELVSRFRAMLRFNPMTYYLEFFHDALVPARVLTADPAFVHGLWPPATTWLIATACSVGALAGGYLLYKKVEHEFIFHL